MELNLVCAAQLLQNRRSMLVAFSGSHFGGCKSCYSIVLFWGCRSPHGERGLKSYKGAAQFQIGYRRSPHGERGLKSLVIGGKMITDNSRSPHGERGLKLLCC